MNIKPKDLIARSDPDYLRELCRALIRAGYGPNQIGWDHIGYDARKAHEEGRLQLEEGHPRAAIEHLKKASDLYRNMLNHGMSQEEESLNLRGRDQENGNNAS